MAEKEENVKLIGSWASPFSRRVEMALKLKGVTYDYSDENYLVVKSPLLLELNPVFKKVPVFIHNGKVLPESHFILEYIDQTWTNNPILPQDPYDKAMARLWAKFVDEQVASIGFRSLVKSKKMCELKQEGYDMLDTLMKPTLFECLEFMERRRVDLMNNFLVSLWGGIAAASVLLGGYERDNSCGCRDNTLTILQQAVIWAPNHGDFFENFDGCTKCFWHHQIELLHNSIP